MNVLVTGGTGVVGTAAIPALLRAGHKVRLLSRRADEDAPAFPEGVEPFPADVSSTEALDEAVRGMDGIVHIAGIVEETPPDVTFERVNVLATQRLVEAAQRSGSPFFIFVSSLGAERGQSDYHRSKFRAEEWVRSYTGPWLILRPGNIYGPGDETISMLLKMVRSLPAVPMVSRGDQAFQPLWYTDFGEVIVQAIGRGDLAGKTLELAGPDTATTESILQQLSTITGRNVPRLSIPVWLTEVGVQALDAFGATGRKLLERAGMSAPLGSAKLDMLLEENVIAPQAHNALADFNVRPTPLAEGLAMLADLLPEQLPGDGVGPVQQSTYWARIEASSFKAAELLQRVCDRIHDVMPIEFAAEPGSPRKAEEGATLTAAITARGNVQVRLEEKTDTRATFVTLEGHPLAGVMQLHAEDLPDGVRFSVHIAAQAANAFDWLAMRTVGGPMQRANWRGVVRRVVDLSGGRAPAGVHHETHAMDASEAQDIRRFAERVVHRQQQSLRAEQAAETARR